MTPITASDGHVLGAYIVKPQGTPKVRWWSFRKSSESIRPFAVWWTTSPRRGITRSPPALFDRFKRDIELGYTGLDMAEAFALYGLLSTESALKDVAAAFAEAKKTAQDVAVVGFCYGGLMSWLSATKGPRKA